MFLYKICLGSKQNVSEEVTWFVLSERTPMLSIFFPPMSV